MTHTFAQVTLCNNNGHLTPQGSSWAFRRAGEGFEEGVFICRPDNNNNFIGALQRLPCKIVLTGATKSTWRRGVSAGEQAPSKWWRIIISLIYWKSPVSATLRCCFCLCLYVNAVVLCDRTSSLYFLHRRLCIHCGLFHPSCIMDSIIAMPTACTACIESPRCSERWARLQLLLYSRLHRMCAFESMPLRLFPIARGGNVVHPLSNRM